MAGMLLAPFSAEASVRENLEQYLRENEFTWEAYDAFFTPASFLGVPLLVLNTKAHARGIRLHDLHHLVTGFGTDLVGEGEVSAWELASGVEALGTYVKGFVLAGYALGLGLANARTKRAYAHGKRARRNLFDAYASYDELLAMPLGELRERVGCPVDGIAEEPRKLHSRVKYRAEQR